MFIDQPGGGVPHTRISVPFEPQILDAGGVPRPIPSNQLQAPQQSQSQHQGGGPVDPDDMELEMPAPPSSTASAASSMPSSPTSTPSPPETLLATPLSTYSSPSGLVHSSLAAAYPGGYPGVGTQKPMSSSSPPSPQRNSIDAVNPNSNQNPQNFNGSDSIPTQRPNLALNLGGFSSSTSRPALQSPFITGPPPPGGAGAWMHGHGTPGGLDMTYMGNIGMNGGNLGFGGNFEYQNGYGYNFPQASAADVIPDTDSVDMGCVQPALLFSTPSSPQSVDDEDADAEFDIDIEEHEAAPQPVSDTRDAPKEVKKDKAANKTSPPKGTTLKTKGQLSAPSTDSSAAGTTAPATASTTVSSGASVTAAKPAPRIGRPPTAGGGTGLLQSKPFRCPKPNCNKSYKQANGRFIVLCSKNHCVYYLLLQV